MNPYLEPHSFLGTGASLLADVTLLAYLLLIIPAMLAGFVFARRKMHRPQHKWTMTGITVVNWVLIIFLMLFAYRYDVAPNISDQPNNTRYLLPVIHALFGLPAQLLATFVVLRMFREDSQVRRAKARGETQLSKYWFKRAKPVMRLTLTLWLITAVLGVISYLTRYDIIPAYHIEAQVAAPVETPEVGAPVSTQELLEPLGTPEASPPVVTPDVGAPLETPEVTPSPLPPIATEISEPVETEELAAEASARTPAPPAETKVAPPVETEELFANTATRRPSATRAATRTPVPPAETEELIAKTPTRRPSATRTATRAHASPAETEVVAPVRTEELTTGTLTPIGWIRAATG